MDTESIQHLIGGGLAIIIPILVVGLFICSSAIKVLREYERGVIFRLGKLQGAKGPGIIFLIPIVDKMVRMDLRVVTIDVPKQEIMTRDNVPATVDAVIYFRVVDPNAAVVKVENYWKATSLIAQTTLRSVLGQSALDELLSQRDVINQKLQEIIDKQTEPWGIKVTSVETKEVSLPDSMKRAMAKQAEAERERRAKVVNARGRIPGRRKNGAGRRVDREGADRAATALSPDHARDGERTQHDDVPAAADRFVQRVFEKVEKSAA